MATVRKFQVTFDCADPARMTAFWCAALGYVDSGYDGAADPEGVGPRLYFQRVPEGKKVKNRVHLDIRVGTGLVGAERLAVLEAECVRLEALGATRGVLLEADDENESCQNMVDVEGNEFCLD